MVTPRNWVPEGGWLAWHTLVPQCLLLLGQDCHRPAQRTCPFPHASLSYGSWGLVGTLVVSRVPGCLPSPPCICHCFSSHEKRCFVSSLSPWEGLPGARPWCWSPASPVWPRPGSALLDGPLHLPLPVLCGGLQVPAPSVHRAQPGLLSCLLPWGAGWAWWKQTG